jgi:3-hydroxyisobutyrate dehydrogenase-like beta-hydroxyacid dehydrogenase
MIEQIGFIGLGNLGAPIALNLAQSGNSLFVYNRTQSKTGLLAAKGAIVCDSIGSLANQCKIVFTIVSDDLALKEICEAENGLLNHLQKGSIHISMSTILPQTATYLAALHQQKGQHYLSAPVFGRPEAALTGKLNFVISGDKEIRELAHPLLKGAGGLNIWDFGDNISAANTVKLCGNFLIASAVEAIGESIKLAGSSGVDAEKMWLMLSQTLFNAPVYHNYSSIILQKKFEPAAFSMKLGLKDMNLVLQQAGSAGQSMPFASLLQSKMKQMVDNGKENIDWSAVSEAELS